MKRTREWPRVMEVDYSAARAQAVRWLGDRYLLAKPINGNYGAGRKVRPAAQEPKPWQGTTLCAIAKIAGRCY